jgi:hypothetical protein
MRQQRRRTDCKINHHTHTLFPPVRVQAASMHLDCQAGMLRLFLVAYFHPLPQHPSHTPTASLQAPSMHVNRQIQPVALIPPTMPSPPRPRPSLSPLSP